MAAHIASLETTDLEVLCLEGNCRNDSPAVEPRWRRGSRWPWATVGVALVAGLVALPVRANVAAVQFRRLAAVWARAQALEPARRKAVAQLEAATVASDEAHLIHGTAALDEDEAARIQALRRQVYRWLVPDGQLERLRGLMRRTMSHQEADLAAAAGNLRRRASLPDSPFASGTVVEMDMVGRQLATLRLRFGQRPAVAVAPPTALGGAAADLAALHHYLDEPTGITLATTDGSAHLRLLSLDGSRASSLDLGPDTSASRVVARRGYIAVLIETPGATLVVATSPSGPTAGPPRILARGASAITAAPLPDRLWVATDQGAVEVDGSGAVVAGPVSLPTDAMLTGATTAALLSERQNGQLLATSLADGSSTRLADLGEVVAAQGSSVAWAAATSGAVGVSGPNGSGSPGPGPAGRLTATLHLSTDGGKTSRVFGRTPDSRPLVQPIGVGPGAFSPDGRYLALWWLENLSDLRTTYVFGVINLNDSQLETVAGTPEGLIPRAVTWAPDGTRVFFIRGDSATELWSYQPGRIRAEAVRIRGFETDDVAAVATPPASPPTSPSPASRPTSPSPASRPTSPSPA